MTYSVARLADEVRWAIRSLAGRPAQTLIAIAMLAIGIAANGAVFAIVDAALFKGFAFVHDNERLVRITTTRNAIYVPDFHAWQTQARAFQGLALVRGVFHALSDQRDAPDAVFTMEVTTNTFGLLGVSPLIGRDFVAADSVPGAPAVAILRYSLWKTRFGSDPAAIGRTIRLDGVPTTIIAVMPDGFSFPADQQMWTPLVPTAAALRRDTTYTRYAYGRLADGATLAAVRQELDAIGQRLAQAYPDTNRDLRPVATSFDEWFVGRGARQLYLGLWGAVACVMVIAGANVAGLFVVRSIGRSQEMAIRLALGADRWSLVRQLVIEGLLLSSTGALLGLGVASLALARLPLPTAMGNLDVRLDGWTLGYLAAIAAIAGVAAGLAPLAQLRRSHAGGQRLQPTRAIAGSRHEARLLDTLVSVEMALTLVLLLGAGVLIRSVRAVTTADIGVVADRTWTASLYLPPERYGSAEARLAFFRDLAQRASALPEVISVGLGAVPPTSTTPRLAYALPEEALTASTHTVGTCVISPGYVRTIGAVILAGRDLAEADRSSAAPVALVNQRFADMHWPGQSAVGKLLRLSSAVAPATGAPWTTVVGVVSNIVQDDRTRQSFAPVVYLPYAQYTQPNMFLFARSGAADTSLAEALRRVIDAADPSLPVPAISSLADRLGREYAVERQTSAVLGAFAVVALALACVGLYAVVAHSVTRRTREIGIRMAVGATAGAVVGLVVSRAARALAIGTAAGAGLAMAAKSLVASQLVGVSPTDPLTIVGALLVLGGAALLACWMPARRAAQVDPATTLRIE